jgi:hypothetical protein
MEADCKSAGSAYGGSNPSLPTLENWLSGLKREPAKFLISVKGSVGSNPTFSVWEISSVVEQCADNAEVASSNLAFPT